MLTLLSAICNMLSKKYIVVFIKSNISMASIENKDYLGYHKDNEKI